MILRPLSILCISVCAQASCAAADAAPRSGCERVAFETVPVVVCTYPRDADVRVFRSRGDGSAIRKPEDAGERLGDGERLVMAMNGGMYHRDLSPVGLYVENGMEAAPLQTRAGPGNFGMVPNGVFWVDADGAHVSETRAFAASGAEPDHATQSGPMLVIDGALHPRFIATSTSRKIRNGVGVGDGVLVFIKSEAPINFDGFARLFVAQGADNALYLDGTVSRMWSADLGESGRRFPIGPLIAVVE